MFALDGIQRLGQERSKNTGQFGQSGLSPAQMTNHPYSQIKVEHFWIIHLEIASTEHEVKG